MVSSDHPAASREPGSLERHEPAKRTLAVEPGECEQCGFAYEIGDRVVLYRGFYFCNSACVAKAEGNQL